MLPQAIIHPKLATLAHEENMDRTEHHSNLDFTTSDFQPHKRHRKGAHCQSYLPTQARRQLRKRQRLAKRSNRV